MAVLGLASSSQAARHRPCEAGGTRTRIANSHVRVYRQERGDHFGEVYACSLRTGRRIDLGLEGDFIDYYSVAPIRLAGDMVAWGENCACREQYAFDPRISVGDVRGRTRIFHRRLAGVPTDLVVARDGSVAWIADRYSRRLGKGIHPVWKLDGLGVAQLDDGQDVTSDSLARSGRTVYWLKAGEARSATLVRRR